MNLTRRGLDIRREVNSGGDKLMALVPVESSNERLTNLKKILLFEFL